MLGLVRVLFLDVNVSQVAEETTTWCTDERLSQAEQKVEPVASAFVDELDFT